MFLLSITDVALPVSWYVVNSTNNTISYTADGLAQTIVLPQGNWDAKSLAQFINTAQTNFSLSYDATSFKFTVSPNAKTIRFANGNTLLSISPQVAGTTSPFIGNVVDLAGTRSVFVRTNLTTRCLDSLSKGRSNLLAKIPVLVESGQVLHYSNPGQFKTAITETDINVIEVFLLDENQQVLDFNSCNWSMTLQFDVVEKASEPLKIDKITSTLQVEDVVEQQNQKP